MVSTTSEFVGASTRIETTPFSLIEQRGLLSRLRDELVRAAHEITDDPSQFIRGLFYADTRDERRRRRIYIGLACAVVVHVALLALIVVLGWHRMFQPIEEAKGDRIIMLPDVGVPSLKPDSTQPEKPAGTKDGGGGGGGQNNPLPPSRGVVPQSLPQPQIVNMNPSNIPDPVLPTAPTIVGPVTEPPPPVPIGDPTGKPGAFSGGPGTGGGIGNSDGTGVGKGQGPGAGPGSGGGPGRGSQFGSPDGSGDRVREVAFNEPKPPGFVPFRWTYRPTPFVTPEAQANKVTGTVLVRATFNADGTISDIEIVNQVDFMTESALEALKRSKFRPATIGGIAVTLRRVPVRIDVHY
jgi:periplasmic protein TonB